MDCAWTKSFDMFFISMIQHKLDTFLLIRIFWKFFFTSEGMMITCVDMDHVVCHAV